MASFPSPLLNFYNSATRRKENFYPLDAKRVRMYVCGPTVYDDAHIGNFRPVVIFDLLFRLLRFNFGDDQVIYARNITDVDDKINVRAAKEGRSIYALTQETAQRFEEDAAALKCLSPTYQPRATEHIGEMITLIERLLTRGYAYVAADHVLFDVDQADSYGTLSGRRLEEMRAGARVEVATHKKGERDFVLWKPAPLGPLEEVGWESPWGYGRPGWHIECSAMSWKYLGEVFDIHGGGIDLIFPHHENEQAQSMCAFNQKEFARLWMHNGFVHLNGQKMSKSEANMVRVRDLLTKEVFGNQKWSGSVLRLALLRTHYRQPLDFTENLLHESEQILKHWHKILQETSIPSGPQKEESGQRRTEERNSEPISLASSLTYPILQALADDLNMPQALLELHKLMRQAEGEGKEGADAREAARAIMHFLGFEEILQRKWLRAREQPELSLEERTQLESWIQQRNAARQAGQWKEADRLRTLLEASGILLKDHKDGTSTWEVLVL